MTKFFEIYRTTMRLLSTILFGVAAGVSLWKGGKDITEVTVICIFIYLTNMES